MKKTYTLVHNDTCETLTGDELLKRMEEMEARGYHIEECPNSFFDFMVCYW